MTVLIVLFFISVCLTFESLHQPKGRFCLQEQEILPDMLPAYAVA